MDKKICTIIVPCYNEQDAIPIYYDKMKNMNLNIGLLMMEVQIIPYLKLKD